mmetsp:Transcript_107254/g.169341  ORF Transcript_107254/g.169341 Transcript_107254/m.169341 type:complete len:218 (-) Transcript_107254:113-766(-)
MPTGKMLRWNSDKGFGFIQPDDGSEDLFCHVSGLLDGDDSVLEGDMVRFRISFDERKGKDRAVEVEAIGGGGGGRGGGARSRSRGRGGGGGGRGGDRYERDDRRDDRRGGDRGDRGRDDRDRGGSYDRGDRDDRRGGGDYGRGDRDRGYDRDDRRGGGGGSKSGGKGKGGQEVRPGDWECRECGINNFASRDECFKCQAAKPGGGGGGRDRDYDRRR